MVARAETGFFMGLTREIGPDGSKRPIVVGPQIKEDE